MPSPRAADAFALPADATVAEALLGARERTLALVAPIDQDDLERVHSTLMSPLVWDLGHIAAFEDLWIVHRLGGEPMLREDLGHVYDAFETPRADRGELPFLRVPEARDYLAAVRERSLAALEQTADHATIGELVVRHELQHQETMLQTLQLARLSSYTGPGRVDPPGRNEANKPPTGLETVPVDGGEVWLGAPADGFAYDNERPRHRTSVAPFRIGRTPVTNGAWSRFADDGGYDQREWWSETGWRWRCAADIERPLGWTDDGREWRLGELEPLDPTRPVIHVSWFEAEAFCRAHGVRMPTELEWETAATWNGSAGTKQAYPWGNEPCSTERANVDVRRYGTAPADGYPDGASPCGALGMLGDVWEWTASELRGYPGFRAEPYREYSEVFFGPDYRVLRGGSWATAARVATPTFRNWDYPQRRQIFAGLRIATNA